MALKIGLETGIEKMLQNDKDISKSMNEHADLIVYCISVAPGSKFTKSHNIMQALQNAYTKDIWKHCIFAFTFSNFARNDCDESTTNMSHIQKCATELQERLCKMGNNVIVITPFNKNDHEKLDN